MAEQQAADYVFISTAAYLLSSVCWIVNGCFILNENINVLLFKTITILVDQLNGIWNVLALYAVMDAYRKQVKQMIGIFFLRCKNRSNAVGIHPASETSHAPTT